MSIQRYVSFLKFYGLIYQQLWRLIMKNLNILGWRRFGLIGLFGFFLFSVFPMVSFGQIDAPSCDADAPDAKDINVQVSWRIIKDTGEDLVLRVAAKYKTTDKEYTDAQNLYNSTRNKYNGYLEAALLQMVQKQKGDLSPSAKDACNSSRDFQKFVVEKTEAKGFLAFLPIAKTLIEFGVGLYDKYESRKQEKRKSIADALRPQVKWRTWNEIVKANNQ